MRPGSSLLASLIVGVAIATVVSFFFYGLRRRSQH
jgi:hypothetical protein